MASKYYLPANKQSPRFMLGLVWLWWLTDRVADVPGWAHGVFWTVFALLTVATVYRISTEEPYDEKKMDRILGRD